LFLAFGSDDNKSSTDSTNSSSSDSNDWHVCSNCGKKYEGRGYDVVSDAVGGPLMLVESMSSKEEDSKEEPVTLKENYTLIRNFFDGKKRLKSGELECIMIIAKGKEGLVADTSVKTGLIVID